VDQRGPDDLGHRQAPPARVALISGQVDQDLAADDAAGFLAGRRLADPVPAAAAAHADQERADLVEPPPAEIAAPLDGQLAVVTEDSDRLHHDLPVALASVDLRVDERVIRLGGGDGHELR